jgi:hypothetical protein
MGRVQITPTSSHSARVGDLILRETSTTRLVFRSILVDNVHDSRAAVKGGFLFQRKSPKGSWDDTAAIDLTSLKAGEGVKLPLKAGEVYRLAEHLNGLYEIHTVGGVPGTQTEFLRVDDSLRGLIEIDNLELVGILDAHEEVGLDVLLRLVDWASRHGNPQEVVNRLEVLDLKKLDQLGSLIGLARLKAVLDIWKAERDNSDEEFWQDTLAQNAFVLSQVFSYPTLVLKEKAYVGGKGIENRGGGVLDFLLANRITGNVALVEIKTPETKLIGSEYRPGVPNISSDLSGAVIQVTGYRDSLIKQYSELLTSSESEFDAFDPECLVIAGDAKQELKAKRARRSFELYRCGLRSVRVITYDELFLKIEMLISLLETA